MRWRLRQYIPQLVSMREGGYTMLASAYVLVATLTVCGWFSLDSDDLLHSARAALAFAASTTAIVTVLDASIWVLRRLSRPP